ncbi:MAG: TetR-like C-terminal domain-containing protein [Sandaracinaceae bacterium]
MATDDDDPIERIYQALVARQLDPSDLSARKLAAFLGKTTGVVYHRWSSVDGLLFAVAQRGFEELGARLLSTWERTHELADCAQAFVEFGLDHPVLYPLMFERRHDWAALRAAGAFQSGTPGSGLLAGVVCLMQEAGSQNPMADTRLLMAGLHGLVSFAASGRMNVGELGSPDRAVAVASARDLATRVIGTRAADEATDVRVKKGRGR